MTTEQLLAAKDAGTVVFVPYDSGFQSASAVVLEAGEIHSKLMINGRITRFSNYAIQEAP